MDSHTVNVLLTTFAGLSLPQTLSLPTPASTTISTFTTQVTARLPPTNTRLFLTTNSNRQLSASSSAPISSLLSNSHDTILPLRLTVPLCGGKGGFGSQLRAAGGRMSSRKKKHAGEANSSNRNLDGRRLRTVNEAKALAEYLALKPEMEKKGKEARRKRWEQVVETAERREDEIRSGKGGKVDGRWMEEREEAGERAREAVKAAMKSGIYYDKLTGGGNNDLEEDESSEEDCNGEARVPKPSSSANGSTIQAKAAPSQAFFGFDDDDEFMSDDSENGEAEVNPVEGKGKAKL